MRAFREIFIYENNNNNNNTSYNGKLVSKTMFFS